MSSRRYAGILAYDGSRYAGFQRQAAGTPTIQAALEAAVTAVTGQTLTVLAAGRTDAGVHASGQVIAFDAVWTHPVEALWRAINANLPPDIALQTLAEAVTGFHPRFDALRRRYRYRFYAAPVRDPLKAHLCWYTGRGQLDRGAMQAAADLLVGTHDFATFGQPPYGESTRRTVYQAQFDEPVAGVEAFVIEANAFLQHMVRSLVGTLVEVGRGQRSVAAFGAALAAAERSSAGQTAPPQGLVLEQVSYRGQNPWEIKDDSQDLDTQS